MKLIYNIVLILKKYTFNETNGDVLTVNVNNHLLNVSFAQNTGDIRKLALFSSFG